MHNFERNTYTKITILPSKIHGLGRSSYSDILTEILQSHHSSVSSIQVVLEQPKEQSCSLLINYKGSGSKFTEVGKLFP